MPAQATKQGRTVQTQSELSGEALNHNTKLVREQPLRRQTQPPQRAPLDMNFRRFSPRRNAFGLAQVFIAVMGTIYLIFGNLTR